MPNRLLCTACVLGALGGVTRGDAGSVPARGISDNSFLIEEAYNQERGVVQHILTFQFDHAGHDRSGELAFTQEWPIFSQTHQFSYTVPLSYIDTDDETDRGVGDIELTYRLQLFTETETRPAVAPAFSVVLPTGDEDRGLGLGEFSYEILIPVSKVVTDRITLHGNAGVSFSPDVEGDDLISYVAGGSAIYAVSDDFNLLIESLNEWIDEPDTGHSFSAVLSPGARYAWNFPNDAQCVLGLALPIGLTDDAPDWGVFVYLSFEHSFE